MYCFLWILYKELHHINKKTTINSQAGDFIFPVKTRKLNLPFTVMIKSRGRILQVTADKALRIAPGKRLVCSGMFDDKPVVMKFFLNSMRTGHYYKKELNGLKAMASSGINTPGIVFYGRVEKGCERVIGLEQINPAQDMVAVLSEIDDDIEKYKSLQKKIIREIALLHNYGIKQDDLHLGNFLLSHDKIYTIDGDSVDTKKMGTPLPQGTSLKNLALFFSQFYPCFDNLIGASTEYYAQCRQWEASSSYLSSLLIELKRVRGKKEKKYLRKIFRECSEFVRHKSWNINFVCDRKAFDSGFSKIVKDLDSIREEGILLNFEKTFAIYKITINNTLYVLKHYRKKSGALTAWRNAHMLKEQGVNILRPVLVMEKGFGPIFKEAYFIVKDTRDLKTIDYLKFFKELENRNLTLDIMKKSEEYTEKWKK